jgi:hypothetical protein
MMHILEMLRTLDVGKKALILGEVVDEALQSATNHGVLAHEDDALTAERHSDFVHLLGRDIVDGDDEDALVFLQEVLELIEVDSLRLGFAPHFFGVERIGSLRTYSWVQIVV